LRTRSSRTEQGTADKLREEHRRRVWALFFVRSISSGSLAMFAAIRRASFGEDFGCGASARQQPVFIIA
jgi:hypothetical protein